MRISCSILLVVLTAMVSVAARAQSQHPRSSIHAGVGVIIHHYYRDNPYNQRYFGPAMSVGYEYRFAKNLSVFAWGGIGQIRLSEPRIFTRDPSLPGVIKGVYSTGTVSNAERISLGVACMFNPWPWLSLGVGPYGLFNKSAYGQDLKLTIVGPEIDYVNGGYVTKEIIPFLDYADMRYFRYGIAFPVMVQLYSNDTLSVRVSYQTCFFRESQGKFRMGTNAAMVSLAVYL